MEREEGRSKEGQQRERRHVEGETKGRNCVQPLIIFLFDSSQRNETMRQGRKVFSEMRAFCLRKEDTAKERGKATQCPCHSRPILQYMSSVCATPSPSPPSIPTKAIGVSFRDLLKRIREEKSKAPVSFRLLLASGERESGEATHFFSKSQPSRIQEEESLVLSTLQRTRMRSPAPSV